MARGDHPTPPPRFTFRQDVTSDNMNILSDCLAWRDEFPAFTLQGTTLTDLLQGACLFDTTVMGLFRQLRVEAWGSYFNNGAANRTSPIFALAYNGTELVKTNTGPTLTKGANTGAWYLEALIQQNGLANSQTTRMEGWVVGGVAKNWTTGEGWYGASTGSAEVAEFRGRRVTAVNMSVAAAFEIRAQLASAEAALHQLVLDRAKVTVW